MVMASMACTMQRLWEMKSCKTVARSCTIAALVFSSWGCQLPPPARIDGHGNHTVGLSSNDNLLPQLAELAQHAGCQVGYGWQPRGVEQYGAFVARCGGEWLRVSQTADQLSYRCARLKGDECDRLMLKLAPSTARN